MDKTAEEPLDVLPSRKALGVSDKHRRLIVVLLVISNVISQIGFLQPYLIELQKPVEYSNSNSLFTWFLLYGAAGCVLGNQYGFLKITTVGLALAGFWAVCEGLDFSHRSSIFVPNLHTLGASLAFSNSKFAFDIFKPKSFGNFHSVCVGVLGLLLSLGASKVTHVTWAYFVFGALSFSSALLVTLTVPNRRLLVKPPPILSKVLGVAGIAVLQIIWERYLLDDDGLFYWARAVGIGLGALGLLWWVAQ